MKCITVGSMYVHVSMYVCVYVLNRSVCLPGSD